MAAFKRLEKATSGLVLGAVSAIIDWLIDHLFSLASRNFT